MREFFQRTKKKVSSENVKGILEFCYVFNVSIDV